MWRWVTAKLKNWKSWVTLASFVVALTAWLVDLGHVRDWTRPPPEDVIAKNMLSSTTHVPTTPPDLLVRRRQPTQGIHGFLANNHLHNNYLVVFGPRGCGKTTAVQMALAGRKGVITQDLSASVRPNGMTTYTALVSELGIPDHVVRNAVAFKELVVKARAKDKDFTPTTTGELDKETTGPYAKGTVQDLKKLGDEGAADSIVVLSDATAAFSLPSNEDRQKFLWVEDFTKAEANEYFDKRKFLVPANASDPQDANTAKRRRFFHEVGTRAMDLSNVCSGGESKMEAYIAEVRETAEGELEGLLTPDVERRWGTTGEDFTKLVKMLLKAGPKGVHRREVKDFLAKPAKVAPLLKEDHALVYHWTSRSYRFNKPAHRRAAERQFKDSKP